MDNWELSKQLPRTFHPEIAIVPILFLSKKNHSISKPVTLNVKPYIKVAFQTILLVNGLGRD